MSTTKARTRLSPAARTQQLLATAKTMILEHGLQSFTMEALARTADGGPSQGHDTRDLSHGRRAW